MTGDTRPSEDRPHPTLSQPWGDPDYDPSCPDCRARNHGRLASEPPLDPLDVAHARGFREGYRAALAASRPAPDTRTARQSFIDGYAARVVDDPNATPESVARLADRYIERISARFSETPSEAPPTELSRAAMERLAAALEADRG